MERHDNSTCLPGKKDAVKIGSLKRLKHVLTEYVYNLHDKYLQSKPKFFFEIKTQAYPVKDTPNYIKMSATDKLGVKLIFLCNPDVIL